MFLFRRLALALALAFAASHLALAQDSPSSSTPPAQQPGQPQSSSQAQQPANDQGSASVQDRIRMRREQRRAAAIRDVYTHLYEANIGMGYLRFVPGHDLQRVTYYGWQAGFTRYYNERLGVTLEGRGYYGTAFVGVNPYNVTRPAISTYTGLIGPTYRFYMQPKYSIAGRAMAGYARGNFSGDTNGFGGKTLGLWPDGGTYAISASVMGEWNLSPALGLRLSPEYFFTGFGSSFQGSRGFTGGLVYRFGKQ